MATEEHATKLIAPLSEERGHVEYVKYLLRDKLAKKAKPFATYQGATVYLLGDRQQGYVVLEKAGEVLYFVRHELVKHNKLHFGRQVLVWRNKEVQGTAARGFAIHVFFNYLLPKYKALLADKEQTRDGKQFWEYALDFAFQKKLFVYYLDRRSTPNALYQLEDYADVIAHEDDLWGYEQGHLRTFAVISSVPLQLKGS
jgi:hypothetical protein